MTRDVIRTHQPEHPGKKPLFTWLCALAPLFLFVAFATFGLHLRLACGEWPDAEWKGNHYYDASAILLRVHGWMLELTIVLAVLVAPPLWLVLLCLRSCRLSLGQHCAQAGIGALGWGLFVAVVLLVPPKFLAWFLT